MLSRIIATLIGVALLIYGVLAAISPLPLGVPLIIFGLLLIAAANPFARPVIRRLRRRFRWFDAIVRTLGRTGPERIRSVVEETHPDEANDEDAETGETEDDPHGGKNEKGARADR